MSVILERDLGDRRFPGAMLTFFSGIMFGVTIMMLHRRDLRLAEAAGISIDRSGGADAAMAPVPPGRRPGGAGRRLRGPEPRRVAAARARAAPRSPSRAPYECGIVPGREPPERFPVRFYLVAMIFIVFDIEIIFLYPWAVDLPRASARSGWSRSLIFAVAVFVSFVYLIANGALDWGPVKQLRRRSTDGRRADRTTTTTDPRVGLDGRSAADRRRRRAEARLMHVGRRARASRGSTTTSSPASSRTS